MDIKKEKAAAAAAAKKSRRAAETLEAERVKREQAEIAAAQQVQAERHQLEARNQLQQDQLQKERTAADAAARTDMFKAIQDKAAQVEAEQRRLRRQKAEEADAERQAHEEELTRKRAAEREISKQARAPDVQASRQPAKPVKSKSRSPKAVAKVAKLYQQGYAYQAEGAYDESYDGVSADVQLYGRDVPAAAASTAHRSSALRELPEPGPEPEPGDVVKLAKWSHKLSEQNWTDSVDEAKRQSHYIAALCYQFEQIFEKTGADRAVSVSGAGNGYILTAFEAGKQQKQQQQDLIKLKKKQKVLREMFKRFASGAYRQRFMSAMKALSPWIVKTKIPLPQWQQRIQEAVGEAERVNMEIVQLRKFETELAVLKATNRRQQEAKAVRDKARKNRKVMVSRTPGGAEGYGVGR